MAAASTMPPSSSSTARTIRTSTPSPTRMLLRRHSSAASATLARRTKLTTPTTSPRYSSRPWLMHKGESLTLPFFYELLVNEQARNYEIPTPNLRIPGNDPHGGIGPNGLARTHGDGECAFRPDLASSGKRQAGSESQRRGAHRPRPVARNVHDFSLRPAA